LTQADCQKELQYLVAQNDESRIECQRLGLLNQDSSYKLSNQALTESELPNDQV